MKDCLYYFPQKALLCTTYDGINFQVINGGWDFELKEDYTANVLGKKSSMGKPEEHTRESFNKKYPGFGY